MLVAEGVEPGKIRVTHNAVNPAKIACAVNAATGSDKSDEVVVGFVGSLRSWHGIDLFMQAIPKVLQANPRVVFRIVGSGELEGEFRRFVDRAGRASRVLFVGRVSHEEALAHVVNMDIAVMPNSNAYGSPMKIFEYMALGKATIAPRLGPLEEIICDGVTGILIDPDNQNSLCGAIVELAQDAALRETIGRRAKEYVLGHHTWRKNAEQIVEAFAALDSGAMLEARPATG